ncbi:MAG TPA: DUF3048 domain-containing protein [Candidatus Nanopelagicales bacterium]
MLVRRPAIRPVLALLALGLCAACSSGAVSVAAPSASPVLVSPSASPTPAPPSNLSPLSGRPGGAGKQVLVVKVDNTRPAQPQVGLRSADIVYIEEVEGGLSRLAVVFSTSVPKLVGPIRSARISDIELLAQYGAPAFAFSGAQTRMLPLLKAAPFYEVVHDLGAKGFSYAPGRSQDHGLMGRAPELLAQAPKASIAHSIGFTFSTAVPPGGRPVRTATAPYPASSATFVWNAKAGVFNVWLNGSPSRASEGGTQQATTVVLQSVRQYDSGFGDRYGGRTPMLVTVGTGTAWVLRNGKVWQVRWSRPTEQSGTTFTAADGSVLPFAPGQIWVALVNSKAKVKIT